MGGLKGEKIGENICGRWSREERRGGGTLFMGVNLWGTHAVRPYGISDEGALLSLNFHL